MLQPWKYSKTSAWFDQFFNETFWWISDEILNNYTFIFLRINTGFDSKYFPERVFTASTLVETWIKRLFFGKGSSYLSATLSETFATLSN